MTRASFVHVNYRRYQYPGSMTCRGGGGSYSGGLIFGGGAYIWNEVSVSTCGGFIHGGAYIRGGGLIVGGLR